jgi:transposase, IS30 family
MFSLEPRSQGECGSQNEHLYSGFAMLVPLPDGYKPKHVAPAVARKVRTLPQVLRRSLTWDQGPEMRDWNQVHVDAGT